MSWTAEQQKVIDESGKTLLVSAAAGSGKTAVLVERIVRKITEEKIDIDSLLVMTFTNAAAAEMRERIGKALNKALEADPENEHLQRQSILVHHAQITTIHSFCLNIVRNYFEQVNLDPGFRIADTGEMTLIAEDVLQDVLENWYGKDDERFRKLAESYLTAKKDDTLQEIIWKLADCAESCPWPEDWLAQCREDYEHPGPLSEEPWMNLLLDEKKRQLAELIEDYRNFVEVCEENGPERFTPMYRDDLKTMEGFREDFSYTEMKEFIDGIAFGKMTSAKTPDITAERREEIKNFRKGVKDKVSGLKPFFAWTEEEITAQTEENCELVQVLTEVTADYLHALEAKKREKNLVDFGDLEHYALQILTEEKEGEHVPGSVALQYRKRYSEVMIDEYQDSSRIQEAILSTVCADSEGRHNLFMVGDVKQSIYKFRQARPELFMDKLRRFPYEGETEEKIELGKNFRSRREIVDGVNCIFRQIMREPLGGITYDDTQALTYGADYYETVTEEEDLSAKNSEERPIELLFLDLTQEDGEQAQGTESDGEAETDEGEASDHEGSNGPGKEDEEPSELDLTNREQEALMIAHKILELTDQVTGITVYDKDTKKYRPAEYRDVAILLRTGSGWFEPFTEVLNREGIPAAADSSSGYFSAREVQVILNYLRVLDNPMQDIPLASVLTSEITGMTAGELADLQIFTAGCPAETGLYGRILFYLEHGPEGRIRRKLERFEEDRRYFVGMERYLSLEELLSEIYERTGYLAAAAAMPGGEKRKANLLMLRERAASYEKNSYKGLFRFIRYIEKLNRYEVDFGEASSASGMKNLVSIMTIHHSKGLEFPIVILAGISKGFNEKDAMEKFIVDSDWGIGMELVDTEIRSRKKTLKLEAMREKARRDMRGEELRVLYVAMTRAREKLICTAAVDHLWDKLEKILENNRDSEGIDYNGVCSSRSYFNWITPCVLRHRDSRNFLKKLEYDVTAPAYDEGRFEIEVLEQAEMISGQAEQEKQQTDRVRGILAREATAEEREVLRQLEASFAADYRYAEIAMQHSTMSVSELKHRSAEEAENPTSDELLNAAETSEKELQAGPSYADPASEGQVAAEQTVTDEAGADQAAAGTADTEKSNSGSGNQGDGKEKDIPKPAFLSEKETKLTGAARGDAYHHYMAEVDFNRIDTVAGAADQAKLLVGRRAITETESEAIYYKDIVTFAESDLGRRAAKAAARGALFREKQFMMGLHPTEIHELHLPSDLPGDREDYVNIQGIIDGYFIEDDEIVLFDYKTDNVDFGNGEQELLRRYSAQLRYYETALTRALGKRVKEKYLYSFKLGKQISVN